MRKKQQHKIFAFTDADKEAIRKIKAYYNLTTDVDVLRKLLHATAEYIDEQRQNKISLASQKSAK